MVLAFRNQPVLNHSLIDTMKLFRGFGYRAFELEVVRGLTDIIALDYLEDYTIEKVNKVSEEIGLQISCLGCHKNYAVNDIAFEADKKLLQIASRYKTNILIVSTALPDAEKEHHPELYNTLYKRTKELCEIAEDAGVQLAIEVEPHQMVNNLKQFFALVEAVDSPALKLNFDIGHIFLSEADLYDAIDESRDYIVYAHIDNMIRGEHAHKLPWDGDIDLLSVCRKLKSTGYDGAVSLDLYLHDYETVAKPCLDYLNEKIFSKL